MKPVRLWACAAVLASIAAPANSAVTISSQATKNMTCSNGVCVPTAGAAVLNTSDLEALLGAGNAKILTLGAGVQAKDIVVKSPLSWSASTTLTLDAYRSILVNSPVSASAPGPGVTCTTNDGGKGGVLRFGRNGNVTLASAGASLIINGVTYTPVFSVQSLAWWVGVNPAGNYALGASYDAGADGTYKGAPIKKFKGQFNGLGNAITNLSISSGTTDHSIGLFGSSSGALASIRLTGVYEARRTAGDVGGLVGTNSGIIDNSQAAVDIHAYGQVGGLAGTSLSGSISDSSASGRINGSRYSGGLVGLNEAPISNSYATGSVKSKGGIAGGLAGDNTAVIENSYATGNVVSGEFGTGGGLVGGNGGSVTNSFATGSVTDGGGGDANIGGLFGDNTSTGIISNSYAIGATSEWSGCVGGLGGQNYGEVIAAYSTGTVQATGGDPYMGGLMGCDYSSAGIASSYWNTSTSGITDPGQGAGNIANDPGITGLTTEQLQAGLPAGFDPKVWAEQSTINDGLPYLLANPPGKVKK